MKLNSNNNQIKLYNTYWQGNTKMEHKWDANDQKHKGGFFQKKVILFQHF